MKQFIVLLTVAGFCVAFFAPHATASQWAPTKVFPHTDRIVIRPEYDEGGWGDPHLSPVDVWYFFRYSLYSPTMYWLFEIFDDLDRGDDSVTNPNDQNNDPAGGPQLAVGSDSRL